MRSTPLMFSTTGCTRPLSAAFALDEPYGTLRPPYIEIEIVRVGCVPRTVRIEGHRCASEMPRDAPVIRKRRPADRWRVSTRAPLSESPLPFSRRSDRNRPSAWNGHARAAGVGPNSSAENAVLSPRHTLTLDCAGKIRHRPTQ
jgi:hypothetical protein